MGLVHSGEHDATACEFIDYVKSKRCLAGTRTYLSE